MGLISQLVRVAAKTGSKLLGTGVKPATKLARPTVVPVGKNAAKNAAEKQTFKGFIRDAIREYNETYNSKVYQEYREIFNKGVPSTDPMYMW